MLYLEVIRLRQFIEAAIPEVEKGTLGGQMNAIIELKAALRGEWLWQNTPGWDPEHPEQQPPTVGAPRE